MRLLLFSTIVLISISSCWTKPRPRPTTSYVHVIGNKPVYLGLDTAKKISYMNTALPVAAAGNIYAKGDRIYQLELGRGIHVIDNSVPSQAHRIGFITVNGSSQISIRDNYLYVNNYNDLVTIDISNPANITEVHRITNAFQDGLNNYYLAEPAEQGYYQCFSYYPDSVVVGWVKDSIWTSCFKN
ncbi:MAG: hypothetical protein ABIN36_11170 [Ferruginibacter sp.]